MTKSFEEYFDKSLNLDVLNAIDVDIDETKKTNEDCIMARYKRFLEGDKKRIKDNGCSLLQNNTYEQLVHAFRAADYDDLTIGLSELISEFSITIPIGFEPSVIRYNITSDKFIATEQFINKEAAIKSWQNHSMEGFEFVDAYVSMRRSFFKCFTFDIPRAQDIRIREVSITLNTSIFEYGTSPSQFFFYLTYPNQLFSTTMGSRNKLSAKDATSQYKFTIELGPMKVVKRRDKDRDRCNIKLKNHDNLHLEHIIEKVGCNPTYWKIPSTYPNCSTPEQLDAINEQLGREDNFMPPCRSVAQIQKTVEGQSPCRWFCQGDPYLKLLFFLDQEVYYEEIVLMPSYSLQSLVGNAGKMHRIFYIGYFGLIFLRDFFIYASKFSNVISF